MGEVSADHRSGLNCALGRSPRRRCRRCAPGRSGRSRGTLCRKVRRSASLRPAQTAKTMGRPVIAIHSSPRSSVSKGRVAGSTRRAASPMSRAASALPSMAARSAGCEKTCGSDAELFGQDHLRDSMAEVREPESVASVRISGTELWKSAGCCARGRGRRCRFRGNRRASGAPSRSPERSRCRPRPRRAGRRIPRAGRSGDQRCPLARDREKPPHQRHGVEIADGAHTGTAGLERHGSQAVILPQEHPFERCLPQLNAVTWCEISGFENGAISAWLHARVAEPLFMSEGDIRINARSPARGNPTGESSDHRYQARGNPNERWVPGA